MKIHRKFLWDWGAEGMKIAWVNWETLCTPKGEGGLDIKNVKTFNEALLAKWKWRLGLEEKGMWKEVLESKYGSWRSLDVRKSVQKESRWWKDLRKICESGEDKILFEENVRWKVGSRTRILFREDKWIGDRSIT